MLRYLFHCCRRPSLRFGIARDRRSPRRNTCFASFLAENNRRNSDIDRHNAVLKGRRLLRNFLLLLVTGGGAWIVVESARALAVF